MPRVKINSYEKYNNPFAANMRLLMDLRGVSQQELADFIGVTRQAVSAYSLGISLPDISKFEKIADYFDVSTEYLLGRTDVMRADIEKQAISAILQLSEEAINKILELQEDFSLEQSIENDWKLAIKEKIPLADMFSGWLEAADLNKLMSNLFRTMEAAANAQASGYHPESYQLDEEDKDAAFNLKKQGYVTLTPTEQMEYYEQRANKVFQQSVEKMESDIIRAVIEISEAEKLKQSQPEN
jgi:transcriptional regulator with XRE-family HTH domain